MENKQIQSGLENLIIHAIEQLQKEENPFIVLSGIRDAVNVLKEMDSNAVSLNKLKEYLRSALEEEKIAEKIDKILGELHKGKLEVDLPNYVPNGEEQ